MNKPFYITRLCKRCECCHSIGQYSIYDNFICDWANSNEIEPPAIRDTIISFAGHRTLKTSIDNTETPGVIFYTREIKEIDENLSKFKRWFMTNLYKKIHDRIYPIPFGIRDEEMINYAHIKYSNKKNKCYANFSMTNSDRGKIAEWASEQSYIDCYFSRRFPALDKYANQNILQDNALSKDEFWHTLSSYKYCLSPPGVGLDCDRVWECIFLNVVPIVTNNYMNRVFSKIWPMILVDKYDHNIPKLIDEFEKIYGKNIMYDRDLLMMKNIDSLLDRLEDESWDVI